MHFYCAIHQLAVSVGGRYKNMSFPYLYCDYNNFAGLRVSLKMTTSKYDWEKNSRTLKWLLLIYNQKRHYYNHNLHKEKTCSYSFPLQLSLTRVLHNNIEPHCQIVTLPNFHTTILSQHQAGILSHCHTIIDDIIKSL